LVDLFESNETIYFLSVCLRVRNFH